MREGWKLEMLESVITQFLVPQRDRPKVFDGDIPWCRIEDIDGIYLSKSKSGLCVSQELISSMPLRVYPKGTVIVSCSADLGRCAIIANPLITNQTFIGLVPSKDIDSLYLYYLMGSKASKLNEMASGATIKYLSKKKFQELEIPIPSLSEQKQIVTILDKTFTAIDQAKANIEKNIENAAALFQSKLNDIFSQKGEGWEEKSFQELSSRIGDGLHGTPNYDEKGEYFFINGNNLNDGKIEIKENTKRVNKEEFENHKRELTLNTVLISINGTLGKVAFYNNEPVILGKSACYINFIEEVNKYYIKYLVKSSLFFKNMAKESTGATIKNFSLKSMRNYKLFLPSINEQEEIVDNLKSFENKIIQMESNYHQKLANLEDLKKSLLQKAFAGELTSPEGTKYKKEVRSASDSVRTSKNPERV